MTKYFSVDISNDIHIINLCETLEQARETCLAGAAEAHEFADDMDDYENYEINDLPYAVYGVVLGKAECKKKKLTEEGKDERCSDLDYDLGKPEIVDYPKDDDWIKCSDRLPPLIGDRSKPVLVWCDNCGQYDIGVWDECDGWDVYCVTHWQPLPLPPTE